MNIGRVYTPPTFIARGIAHSTRGIGACDEYWNGVHPFQHSSRGVYRANTNIFKIQIFCEKKQLIFSKIFVFATKKPKQ